jgi:hypothetical protein
VLLDTVQYTKNSVINRNKIRVKEGECYLTIPIERKYHQSRIIDVRLPEDKKWMKKHEQTIERNYVKSPFFKDYQEFFQTLYEKDYEFLWQINEEIIRYLLEKFNINLEIVKSSDLGIDPQLKKTDMIIDILRKIDAKSYLSGPSGKDYLEENRFKEADIELQYFEFKHPVYPQRYPGFVPKLSSIDLLFNTGRQAGNLI